MRQILVDHARRRNAAMRGGGALKVTIGAARANYEPPDVDLLALDQNQLLGFLGVLCNPF